MTQFEKNLRTAIGVNRAQDHLDQEVRNAATLMRYLEYLSDPQLDGL